MSATTGSARHAHARPWHMTFDPRPLASARIWCLPFAGGGAPFFGPWSALLPRSIELRAVQPPGRQDRIREAPFQTCAGLVTALADALAPELGELPFAFFGHSMGALVSFELARELRRREAPQPALLALSAWPPPDAGLAHMPIGDLPDAAFLQSVRALGGMPEEVLAVPEILDLVLPTLRADFRVCESHRYVEEPPLDCAIRMLGGTADPLAPVADLHAWRPHTKRFLGVHVHPGRHFYLSEHVAAVVAAVAQDVGAHVGSRGARRPEHAG